MDKRMFLEQMLEAIRALPISQIVELSIPLTRLGSSSMGSLCPFHNDRTIGSFVVTDGKNIYKCFSCGEGGDGIKFHAAFNKTNYIEAAFKLGLIFNIISESDYEEYFNKKRYSKEDVAIIEKRYHDLDQSRLKNDIADDDTLNKVYSIFLEDLILTKEHKKHLIEIRCESEEEINQKNYKSFQQSRNIKSICQKLIDMFGENTLQKVPGFYQEYKKGVWTWTYAKYVGIVIPIKNVQNKIVALQIRRDEVSTGSRYVWFSSSFANFKENTRYGTSTGAPIDVVQPLKINPKCKWIFITEGRFKASAIARKWGVTAISVQGVGTWKGIDEVLKALVKNPNSEESGVMIAFDADINYKPQIFKQAKKMGDIIQEKGYPVYYLNWNDSIAKGIDDIILINKESKISRYDKSVWDSNYLKIIKELEDKYKQRVEDIPPEVFKEYFNKNMELSPLPVGGISSHHKRILAK